MTPGSRDPCQRDVAILAESVMAAMALLRSMGEQLNRIERLNKATFEVPFCPQCGWGDQKKLYNNLDKPAVGWFPEGTP